MADPPPSRSVPNFFVAGAAKAGTTSLYHYLAQHPEVFMCPIKEPTFFGAADLLSQEGFRRRQEHDQPALKAYLRGPLTSPASLYVTEWEDYLELFRNVRDEIAEGEASGGYLILPSAAAAIQSRVPHARLIFILRDPVEIAFSWYVLNLSQEPRLTFADWFHREREAEGCRATDIGRYATHLRRFIALFPAEQLRIYLYEDYRRDVRSLLRDVFSFLGLDPDPPIDTSWHNQTAVPRFRRLERWGTRMRSFGVGRDWLPRRARIALRRLLRRSRASFALDAENRRMATRYYRDEIMQTGELIGRDLTAWLR